MAAVATVELSAAGAAFAVVPMANPPPASAAETLSAAIVLAYLLRMADLLPEPPAARVPGGGVASRLGRGGVRLSWSPKPVCG